MSLVSWLCKIYDSVQIQAVCLAGNAHSFTFTQTTLADLAALWDKIINKYLCILNYEFIPNTFLKLFGFSKIPEYIHICLNTIFRYILYQFVISAFHYRKKKVHDTIYSTKTAAQYLQN